VRRIAMVLTGAAAIVVALAAPAAAHVTVEPSSAPKGSDAVLAFVVPTESDSATTVQVQVQFPTDHPIAEALVEPVAGWTATVTQFTVTTPIQTDDGPVTSAVKNVTWKATGKGIAVGDFQEFRVSVGLPDDADSLAFPTVQTYSDNSTVAWTDVAPAGGPEPDHPQPLLTLTAASDSGSTSGSTGAVKKSDVDTAKTLGIVGVVVGALGLLAGAGGIVLGRRRGSGAAATDSSAV